MPCRICGRMSILKSMNRILILIICLILPCLIFAQSETRVGLVGNWHFADYKDERTKLVTKNFHQFHNGQSIGLQISGTPGQYFEIQIRAFYRERLVDWNFLGPIGQPASNAENYSRVFINEFEIQTRLLAKYPVADFMTAYVGVGYSNLFLSDDAWAIDPEGNEIIIDPEFYDRLYDFGPNYCGGFRIYFSPRWAADIEANANHFIFTTNNYQARFVYGVGLGVNFLLSRPLGLVEEMEE